MSFRLSRQLYLVIFIVLVVIGLFALISRRRDTGRVAVANGKCAAHTCGAKDPVSDPKYNVKEIVEQSILLEDHLAIKAKFCIDCITKHFLAIDGYACEALTLAGNKVDQYPMLKELPEFYSGLYETWRSNKKDERVIADVLTKLREKRKQLMAIYLQ